MLKRRIIDIILSFNNLPQKNIMINDKIQQFSTETPDTGRLPLVLSEKLHFSKTEVKQQFISKDHIGSVVYGGLDGIITTFVIVLCACGVDIEIRKIMNIGISSLIANAISMAVSDYVSSKAEIEILRKQKQELAQRVENNIQTQKSQMVDKYKQMGLIQQTSQQMVQILSSNKTSFIEIIMIEKLGLQFEQGNPLLNSFLTFISFTLFGFVPLIPLLFSYKFQNIRKQTYVIISGVITMGTLFILGFSKSILVKSRWYISSFQTIFLGVFAAFGAFGVTRAFGQTIIA